MCVNFVETMCSVYDYRRRVGAYVEVLRWCGRFPQLGTVCVAARCCVLLMYYVYACTCTRTRDVVIRDNMYM